MNTEHNIKTKKKVKHLNRDDKLFFENIYNEDLDISTIYRELERGKVIQMHSDLTEYTTYSCREIYCSKKM